ncbi:hypothetical protein Aam_037_001 [Acidocella aminolytica 101 = DSM 11237]|uniref:Uncharacterized protein n=1 Tax=Acidocella aminolytica 101 = DSM 11237 TaxID=1120923 RepID=A0A0D6PH22_9PROT|nr:hypothetical protein Aam_037_001 [Acidocella aminolytica 101 = DSM 11237]GBQ40066.1 hypothetical protein AA11237_2254 [Acidocella aminolytica 101 = DSM 11237]
MLRQSSQHPLLIHSVNARRMSAARRQYDPGSFGKPRLIVNESEKAIKPPG